MFMAGRRQRGLDRFESQAKHRWLRPAEVLDIIRDTTRLELCDKPANMPKSGSLFLYDRKVLRHFRKDGYRWKKTKDGKAVKEGHERLKVGRVEVLHCYYAHGEENEKFQRRSYWTIEQELSHRVLVHYLEVKKEANTGRLKEAQTGNLLGPESAYNHQASFRLQSFHDCNDAGDSCEPRKNRDDTLREDVENDATGIPSLSFQPSFPETHSETVGNFSKQDSETFGHLFTDGFDEMPVYGIENQPKVQQSWQTSEGTLSCSSNWPMDQRLHSNREHAVTTKFHEEVDAADLLESMGPMQTRTNTDTISKRNDTIEGKADHPSAIKPLLDDGLFNDGLMLDPVMQWMNAELEDLDKPQMQSNIGANWNTVESENEVDKSSYKLEPSLSPDQLFGKYQDDQTCGDIVNCIPGAQNVRGDFVKGVRSDIYGNRFKRGGDGGDSGHSYKGSGGPGCGHTYIGSGGPGHIGSGGPAKAVHHDVFKDQASTANTCETPTKHPTGETPADLASEQGHKRIGRCLTESALSAQLSTLNLDSKEGNSAEISGAKAVSASSGDGESTDGISLIAVSASDEQALSLIGVKSHKAGKRDQQVDAAAIRIQNKFRSWKGRKDFLIIRQRIVKIQAHVRGYQVRKNYRKIVWSVGIVEKIILRWRRKGSGLRGFKPEPLAEGPSMQDSSSKDDDYDVLKEGRKQTEERLQKALARVKSMAQYPEAGDQYHRLLNVVTEIQETKVLNSSEGASAYMDDDLADIEALFDDDIFMPTTAS